MTAFHYHNGLFHIENVDIKKISDTIGTPFYAYSTAAFTDAFRQYQSAFAELNATICYAMKANSNQAVIKNFASLGAGVDVVSEGELRRALQAGIPGSKITYSGVGKTENEIKLALDADVLSFNVESEPELHRLSAIAHARGQSAAIALRVNPDIDAKTHAKISTGKSENKFGIPISSARAVYAEAARLPGITVSGVDMHIGSQITDLQPFDDAFKLLAEFVVILRRDGHTIDHLDLGGGVGVNYRSDQKIIDINDYAALIKKHLGTLGAHIILEPGRSLVANAGIIVTRVEYVKQGEGKIFVIVDAAMNDLIRPTLYEAYHEIKPHKAASPTVPMTTADIVGPVCESGDYLALGRTLSLPREGDLLAVMSAGAYGAVQSGTYNSRPLIPEVMVSGDQYAVIRPRQTYDQMIGQDRLPPWIKI